MTLSDEKLITDNDKDVVDKILIVESLFGILPNDIDLEKSKEEKYNSCKYGVISTPFNPN